MITYTIYLNATPIACVADTNSAYACFEATKTIAEMTGGKASLVWDDTGEIVAYIDFTEEGEEPINECERINCGYYYCGDNEQENRYNGEEELYGESEGDSGAYCNADPESCSGSSGNTGKCISAFDWRRW